MRKRPEDAGENYQETKPLTLVTVSRAAYRTRRYAEAATDASVAHTAVGAGRHLSDHADPRLEPPPPAPS